jgi:SagB-type dehydrogenase family enzyme
MRDKNDPSAPGLSLTQYRQFLKDSIRKEVDFSLTDQSRGIPAPAIEKPCAPDALRVDLPKPGDWQIPARDLIQAIGSRRSHRHYTKEAPSLDEISFLLWATQGLRGPNTGSRNFRTVPSAGCRHAFETYIVALNVQDLVCGIYRYLPVTHQLVFEIAGDNLPAKISHAAFDQRFCGTAAAVFVWTVLPYRMEWRYGPASYKVIAIDAGHICQNLYLACEAINAGTCAVAAYDQEKLDELLRLDGENEFAVYMAPVGKVK